MHTHILGICGTFMAGLAVLASEQQHKVTGSDQNVYPPMSTQLNELGIKIFQGYDDINQLSPKPHCLVVGNIMRRGMPVIEAALNQQYPILSGPEWLARYVLNNKHVLAVSGTHGKTTTASMLAWILEVAGLNPGFLIGGLPNDFGVSARLGGGKYFVVEADEYDSAFFDKRSKFVHYHPRTLIMNNMEFDHADIFADLAAIQKQFHHLVRTVPGEGLIIYPATDQNVITTLQKGCWTKTETFGFGGVGGSAGAGWYAKNHMAANNQFEVFFGVHSYGTLQWSLLGEHNVNNALAAIAAAHHVGVHPEVAIKALSLFQGVKRRMEVKGVVRGMTVYDDFAHHPTAIGLTLAGLRAKIGKDARITAVLDIRSNTMKAGHHKDDLPSALQDANAVYVFQSPDIEWDVNKIWQSINKVGGVFSDTESLLGALLGENDRASLGDNHVIFMSNGGFNGIQALFLEKLT
jgi:UDP-N-acetylmuramate: L-alanyl-gamma-D-glutamyl-meso-diaminopimelate ligase